MPNPNNPTRAVSGRVGGTAARRALTVAAATAAALVLWALAGPVVGVDLSVELDGAVQPVGPMAVAAAGLLAGLAAWGLLALLERLINRPGPIWTVTATVVLLLSLTGPLGSAVGTASLVTTAALHLVVGAVLIPGLGRSARRSR